MLQPNAGNLSNYGEFIQYWDYGNTSSNIPVSLESVNSNIKELYCNNFAYALTWDNEVLTWGNSDIDENNGGSPYYREKIVPIGFC